MYLCYRQRECPYSLVKLLFLTRCSPINMRMLMGYTNQLIEGDDNGYEQ